MLTFAAGKTYSTRSICDHSNIISLTVAKRTAKTITTADGKLLRIAIWHDKSCEYVKPWGIYSMAPMICANDYKATV